ncbi:hypothetical protein CDAR_398861 [Caerostris darwini]|uniref:Uncharacterized protein n=1 Tax=Caerostris darwini TaxID=1538125 RepID=A0AAV4V9X3_9ARAC|nr:hypothetical protein CDAR_398861 [Caerostris darwini]
MCKCSTQVYRSHPSTFPSSVPDLLNWISNESPVDLCPIPFHLTPLWFSRKKEDDKMERADNKAMRLGVKTFWALKTLRFSREEEGGEKERHE